MQLVQRMPDGKELIAEIASEQVVTTEVVLLGNVFIILKVSALISNMTLPSRLHVSQSSCSAELNRPVMFNWYGSSADWAVLLVHCSASR